MSWLDWCVSWAAWMSSSANYYSVKPRRRMSEFWPGLDACGRRTTPASQHSPGTSAPPRSAYLPYTHTHANSASYPLWDGKYEPAAAAESISSMSTQPPIHCGTGNKNKQRRASISSMSTQPPIHCGTENKNQQRRAFISSTSTQPPIHCGTGNKNQQQRNVSTVYIH